MFFRRVSITKKEAELTRGSAWLRKEKTDCVFMTGGPRPSVSRKKRIPLFAKANPEPQKGGGAGGRVIRASPKKTCEGGDLQMGPRTSLLEP